MTQPPGPGLDPDATSYIGAAVSLVRSGLYRIPNSGWAQSDTTEPLAHFPPGFSTAIAVPVAFGVPPVQSARIVIAVSAFVTSVGVFLLMDTIALGALAVAVIFLTPAVVDIHLSVLSEPLFIALLVWTLAAMARVAERPAWSWRLVLGVLAAAAVMVRYAGAGVVAAAVLWVIVQPGPWHRRVRDAGLVLVPTLVVLGAWVVHTTHRAGATGIRRFALYRRIGGTLVRGVRTTIDWLAPGVSHPVWLRWAVALAVAIVAACILARAARNAPRRVRSIVGAALALVVCSAVVIVASRVLADPGIPFDERLLGPSMMLAELAVLAALPLATRPSRIVLGGWWLGSALMSVAAVVDARQDGWDFASADWRFSPTVEWVHDSAAGRTLYTNWTTALYFQAGRDAHDLPVALDPLMVRRFGDRLARTHGLLVGFSATRPDMAAPDSIAARLRLRAVARLSDGVVWEVPVMTDAGRLRAASGSP